MYDNSDKMTMKVIKAINTINRHEQTDRPTDRNSWLYNVYAYMYFFIHEPAGTAETDVDRYTRCI